MFSKGITFVEKYNSAFRELINVKVWSSKRSVRELLGLNKDGDWYFLCTAMDIIADASGAIDHVARFGLSGPTKYDDLGEKYLRLYGVLSAVYIQEEAILELYRIMSVGNYKAAKSSVERLVIRKLRHKLSAHGTSYDSREGTIEAYIPYRVEVKDYSVIAIKNTNVPLEFEPVNLTDAINSHSDLMIDLMDATLHKSIKSLFKGQEKRKAEHLAKLELLRRERKGDLVIPLPTGATVMVTISGAADL